VAAFEAVGVRYVVVAASGRDPTGSPFPSPGTPGWPAGPRLVHRDVWAEIWELPHPAPAFSLEGAPMCRVQPLGWDAARVSCPHPTVLVRRVQSTPGWSAQTGADTLTVTGAQTGPKGLFQAVAVPAGTTTVRFRYLPPGEWWAVPLFALAWLGMVASLVVSWRRRPVGGDDVRYPEPVSEHSDETR